MSENKNCKKINCLIKKVLSTDGLQIIDCF